MERRRAIRWALLGALGLASVVTVLASLGVLGREFIFNALAFGIGSTIALSTMAVIFVPVLRPIVKQLQAMKARSLAGEVAVRDDDSTPDSSPRFS